MLLEINNLDFSHQAQRPLFQNFNLKIKEGRVVAIAGESGCGKSTLLNLIYGLIDAEAGEIIFDGAPVLGPKNNLVPGEPQMKLVAQNYDLMPYATVADNVGKFISNSNMAEKKRRVAELLYVAGLDEYAGTLPKNLSGGQQQRVAIARALSVLPKLLLLDEPFSNLDYSRKLDLRERLFQFVAEKNITLLISTHELQEILPWLDRIIILKDGRLIQSDAPAETYRNPYNAYVAQLFGEVNILTDAEKTHFGLNKNFWYPTQIKISPAGIAAEVLESRFAGDHYWTKVQTDERPLILYTSERVSGKVCLRFN